MTTKYITFDQFCSAVRRKLAFALCLALCSLGLVVPGRAQEHHFIIFDAPFADLTLGDYNGTYPAGINASGAITGYSNDALKWVPVPKLPVTRLTRHEPLRRVQRKRLDYSLWVFANLYFALIDSDNYQILHIEADLLSSYAALSCGAGTC